MPVKRRRSKRRIDPFAEAHAWEVAFATGHDFFRDLADYGLATDEEVNSAMPEAWERLGAIFVEPDMGREFGRGGRYALEVFGDPRPRAPTAVAGGEGNP